LFFGKATHPVKPKAEEHERPVSGNDCILASSRERNMPELPTPIHITNKSSPRTETMIGTLNIRRTKTGHLLRNMTGMMGLCLFIGGCATYEPAPKGYVGATAKLADSVTSDGERCASFFVLEAYDGHDVQNALIATQRRNSGRGMAMTVEGYSRQVPTEEATFHIMGRTHCAAPIIEVGNTVYLIEGDVKFAPQGEGQYAVKGELREDYSAVWVEDTLTGKQRGNKLLVKGSTALNRATLLLLGPAVAKSSKQKVEEIPPK